MLAKNLLLFILVSTLMLGQAAYAQSSDECSITPQWVLDRQQYETTYVYNPTVSITQPVQFTINIPQWVRDRQQYETSYVHLSTASDLQTIENTPAVPQWARDRQQYETTYAYIPMMMVSSVETGEVYC